MYELICKVTGQSITKMPALSLDHAQAYMLRYMSENAHQLIEYVAYASCKWMDDKTLRITGETKGSVAFIRAYTLVYLGQKSA